MIIHTIVPMEDVLEQWEEDESAYSEVGIFQGILQIETLPHGRARILRLISSDPAHYLMPDLQPGKIITNLVQESQGLS